MSENSENPNLNLAFYQSLAVSGVIKKIYESVGRQNIECHFKSDDGTSSIEFLKQQLTTESGEQLNDQDVNTIISSLGLDLNGLEHFELLIFNKSKEINPDEIEERMPLVVPSDEVPSASFSDIWKCPNGNYKQCILYAWILFMDDNPNELYLGGLESDSEFSKLGIKNDFWEFLKDFARAHGKRFITETPVDKRGLDIALIKRQGFIIQEMARSLREELNWIMENAEPHINDVIHPLRQEDRLLCSKDIAARKTFYKRIIAEVTTGEEFSTNWWELNL